MSQNRGAVMGLCLVSALLGGVIGGWMGQVGSVTAQDRPPAPKILNAEEFQLVDPAGRLRAALALSASGQPALSLMDDNNVVRVSLSISDETGVAVHDVDGKTRLVLSVDREGVPSLVVRDRNHRTNLFRPVKDDR